MLRICPNCKSKLDVSSSYFCSFCGQRLPEELKVVPKSVRNTKRYVSRRKSSPLVNILTDFRFKKTVIGLGLISLAVTVAFIFFSNSNFWENEDTNSSIKQSDESEKEVSYKNTKQSDLEMAVSGFNQFGSINYVPDDSSFYFEFSDLSVFNELFSFLNTSYGSLIKSLEGKVSPFFAVFISQEKENYIWNFIFFPAEGYGGVSGEYEDLYIDKVEGVVVITPSEEIIRKVKFAKTGISKNLALNSSYISIKSNLPPEGKIFMISLTEEGKNFVLGLKNSDIPSDFLDLIQSFEDSKSNYLVIL